MAMGVGGKQPHKNLPTKGQTREGKEDARRCIDLTGKAVAPTMDRYPAARAGHPRQHIHPTWALTTPTT